MGLILQRIPRLFCPMALGHMRKKTRNVLKTYLKVNIKCLRGNKDVGILMNLNSYKVKVDDIFITHHHRFPFFPSHAYLSSTFGK